jgi:cell division protein FtsB
VKKIIPQEKTKSRLFSVLLIVVSVAVLVAVGISLGKEAYRRKQIQNEIGNLQQEIQKMSQDNNDLDNLISYLSTSEFKEKEAREKLNLQKGDETMIVLQKDVAPQNKTDNTQDESGKITVTDNSANWQKWLKIFFNNN